jgi:iron complex outermembrane receptor protein
MSGNQPVRFLLKRAVAFGILAGCGAGPLAAEAQQTTPPAPPGAAPAAAPELQTVVVTGTLIARPAAESAEAITIVKATALQSMGIVNVEQALNTITSNNANINIASSVGSFSGGGTYANLRGLGGSRTLVLLDGQRLAGNAFNSNTSGSAVDLSGIPFSALESVQILREGASALYGSDAISGVINFITRKNYQGAEFNVDYARPQEAGGGSGDANFTLGHGDIGNDGYNIMITGSYSEQQELRATQRSFSAEGFYPQLGWASTNNPGTWPATIVDGNGQLWQPDFPACSGNPFLTTYFGNCAYRYSAATDLIPKSDEASGLVSLSKTLPGNNMLAVQYFYTRSKATGWAGPMFYGSFEMTPQADPTYYPTAAGLTCETYYTPCTSPPVLGGRIVPEWTDPTNNRFSDNINTEQRLLVSFSGQNAGWDYKLSLNYSQNLNSDGLTGGWPNEAVLAPTTDPATGFGILSNLINPFGPQSAAGQALINSSYVNGVYQSGKMRRWSVDANASHPLGDAFHAGDDAVVAFGVSASGESYQDGTTPFNDEVTAAVGLTDFAVKGSRTEQAAFIELDVPMSRSLDVDLSDRQDRYSDFGTTNNAKLKVRYQPSRYLTLRGAVSTGFRAPTLFNLYESDFLAASTSGTMGSGNPFCVPGNYNAEWNPAVCNTQGLALEGGNSKLKPETSQNFDFGLVLAPLRNLGITVDYYRILLKNTIGHVPAEAVYGDPLAFSSYIVTNDQGTLTPSIAESAQCLPYTLPSCGYVLLTEQNTGSITTDGIDVSVQYLQHTRFGVFREDLEGTSVTQFRLQQFSGGPVVNMVGAYNGGNLYQPALRWQHELRLDWSSPGNRWGAGLSNRFYSTYIDQNGIGPTNSGPLRTVGSQSTWDTYASYVPIRGLTVLFGIHNLLNTNPPFTNSSQNNFAAGYNSLFSNPILRDFYVNLKYRF